MGFQGIFTTVSVFHEIENGVPSNGSETGPFMNNISRVDFP